MKELIEVFLLTGALFLGDFFSKSKRGFLYYLTMFFIFAGFIFLFSSKSHASQPNYSAGYPCEFRGESRLNSKKEIETLMFFFLQEGLEFSLSKTDRQYFQDKVKFHKENGERTYRDAKNKCWWLPEVTHKEKAKYCFTAATALIAPNDPKSKLIAATLTLLLQYGLDCIDEWNYIQNKLHWSEYHFEMMEFYQEVLLKG